MKDGQLAAIKKRYLKKKKVTKMKQAQVSFQLKETGMQLDQDQKGEKGVSFKSVSGRFRRFRGVLALPPAVHRTDTVHRSTKTRATLWRTRALVDFNTPTGAWRKHQNTKRAKNSNYITTYNCKIHISDWEKNPELNLGHVDYKQLSCFWLSCS